MLGFNDGGEGKLSKDLETYVPVEADKSWI